VRDKLIEVEARFEQLNRKLLEPAVMQNSAQMRELGKEHRQLQSIVEVFRHVTDLEKERDANQQMLATEEDGELLQMVKEELARLDAELTVEQHKLMVLLLPKDANDDKNVILELRSGTGGDEAALFCGELFRAYARLAERKGWKVEVLSSSLGTAGGFKEVVAAVEGEGCYATFKYESGVHRVQRVPATETQGRVHTSAITVAVLPEAEDVEVDILDKDIRVDVYRSSGPGGQSVNTTDSAVRITHIPTGLVVSCQDEKSQHKNKAKALKVLRARLFDKMQAEQNEKIAAERRSQVKTGDRSEKVRTYNFPQDRLTDHRIGLTVHNLFKIMQGDLEEVINSLRAHYQAQALQEGGMS
jgi:peptide chain release factor 1